MALPTTRAYLSDADADDYFIHSFNHAEWMALPVGQKTIALQEATRLLEGLCYQGERCDASQPFQWPRKIDGSGCCAAVTCVTLPPQMIQATAELALQLHKNQSAIIGGGSSQQIKSASLGSMSVTYADGATNTKVSATAPLVLQRFPWLVDVLGPCLMKTSAGGGRVLHRECVTTYNGRFY
jgi:hypothetical protein